VGCSHHGLPQSKKGSILSCWTCIFLPWSTLQATFGKCEHFTKLNVMSLSCCDHPDAPVVHVGPGYASAAIRLNIAVS
jgi:hypothetical protein